MSIVHKFLFKLSGLLPMKRHISDLEKISTENLIEFSRMSVLPAFRQVAKRLPFYKKILQDRGIKVSSIRTIEDFYNKVPILCKEDVFPIFKAHELCMNGDISDLSSAIVTSGTSGLFAYGILSRDDIAFQRRMIDEAMNYHFNAKKEPILIINSLAMGVSFVSSYPVINTSVRSDIAIHIIKTFSGYYKRIVVVCDPHFAKKIIEEGKDFGLNWQNLSVSFVVGGTGSSCSLQQYLLDSINGDNYSTPKNIIQGTMGLTEIGLNIFSAPPELIKLREILTKDSKIRAELFGRDLKICPELFFYYPTSVHIEIHSDSNQDFGEIIISNLDTKSKTPLMRYNTGDTGKFVDRKKLAKLLKESGYEISLKLQLPIIAIGGRKKDGKIEKLTPAIIEEALYRDHEIASRITGHFKILQTDGAISVKIQAKIGVISFDEISSKINQILKEMTSIDFPIECESYKDFGYDLELNYEKKWQNLQ